MYANYYHYYNKILQLLQRHYIDNLRVLTNLKDIVKANNPLEKKTNIRRAKARLLMVRHSKNGIMLIKNQPNFEARQ